MLPTPRADVAVFLAEMAATGTPMLHELPVEDARAMMRAMCALGDAAPCRLARVEDILAPGPAGPISGRLYDKRANRDSSALILFYHGGGFALGDLETHEPFCTYLADRLDMPVLAVDYRLAPEHPFPAAPDDCEAMARWAAQSPLALGFAVTALVTCGDSAGGNLALVVGQALNAQAAQVPLVAIWALYPVVGDIWRWPSMDDLAEGFLLTKATMQWIDTLYAAPGDDPRYAGVRSTMAVDTALVIQTAELDPLRDSGRAFAQQAKQAGGSVWQLEAAGMIHGFINLRRALPSAQSDIEAFLNAASESLCKA